MGSSATTRSPRPATVWYELGDMVCIGDNKRLYYCFPKTDAPVAKARLAAEELYKLTKARRRKTTQPAEAAV